MTAQELRKITETNGDKDKIEEQMFVKKTIAWLEEEMRKAAESGRGEIRNRMSCLDDSCFNKGTLSYRCAPKIKEYLSANGFKWEIEDPASGRFAPLIRIWW